MMKLQVSFDEIESKALEDASLITGLEPEDFVKIATLNELRIFNSEFLWMYRFINLEFLAEAMNLPLIDLETIFEDLGVRIYNINNRKYVLEPFLDSFFDILSSQSESDSLNEIKEKVKKLQLKYTPIRIFRFSKDFIQMIYDIAKTKNVSPEELIEFYTMKGMSSDEINTLSD